MEVRRIRSGVRWRAAELLDLGLNIVHAILWIRVIAEKFARAALAFRLNLFEELDHGDRVIPGIVKDLCPDNIRLLFCVTRIFQKD